MHSKGRVRASRKRVVTLGVTLWTSLTALGGYATNYVTLLFSRHGSRFS